MATGDALEPAYVLHRRPYRESSLLVEFLTPGRGRLGAVARGARSARSRWRGLLEPFQGLLIGVSGRGELGTLSHAEGVGHPPWFSGPALPSAFYASELILRLVRRDDPAPDVFTTYGGVLDDLRGDQEPARVLRRFELKLLQSLGYGIELDTTADGERVDGNRWYRYLPGQGLVDAAPQARGACAGSVLVALHEDDPDAGGAVFMQARRITSAALEPLLGDRPLESRALYRRRRGDD